LDKILQMENRRSTGLLQFFNKRKSANLKEKNSNSSPKPGTTLEDESIFLRDFNHPRSPNLSPTPYSEGSPLDFSDADSNRISAQFNTFSSYFVQNRNSTKSNNSEHETKEPIRDSKRDSQGKRFSSTSPFSLSNRKSFKFNNEVEMDDDFDLRNYTIPRESLFEYPDIGEAFYYFLKQEMNPEPWEFLQDVKFFKKLKSIKEKIKLMNEILELFILPGSTKLLNLSAHTKSKLLNSLNDQLENDSEWVLEIPIDEIFDETERIVKAEMLVDVFPRFTRSLTCLQVLSNYKNNPKVLLPVIVLKNTITDDFVLDNIILDSQIEYFKKASEDSFDYEILSTKTNDMINTFFGTNNYIPKISLVDDITGKSISFDFM
jgi:hypothetical protein